jgi:hypothetical protein
MQDKCRCSAPGLGRVRADAGALPLKLLGFTRVRLTACAPRQTDFENVRCLDGRNTPYPAHHALLNLSSSDTGVRRRPLITAHAPAFLSVYHGLDASSRANTHALALRPSKQNGGQCIDRCRPKLRLCA